MLESQRLDRLFHGLADPTRRRIVEALAQGPASVGALAEPFDMSLAAVVQHVQVLEEDGLVRTQKVGRVRMCTLEPKTLDAAEAWFRERRQSWARDLDRLDALLRQTASGPAKTNSTKAGTKRTLKGKAP